MLLPCPHCRRRFRLLPEQIRSESTKIQCPGCEGLFRINFTPWNQGVQAGHPREAIEEPSIPATPVKAGAHRESPPLDSRRSLSPQFSGGSRNEEETRGSLGVYPKLAKLTRDDRSKPRFLMLWAVAPACLVFLALTGIFLSEPLLNTDHSGLSSSRPEINKEGGLSSSVFSEPDMSHGKSEPDQGAGSALHTPTSQTNNPIAKAFWSPIHHVAKDPCDILRRSQEILLEEEEQDPCQLYPLWITYLILETTPNPACPVEPTFIRAMDAIEGNTLCGPGYAFLSEYYLDRRLIERSQSFLDEALRLTPSDPWVKLVEAVFYEEAYYNDQRAIQILEELNQEHPSSRLAGYLLGKIHIRGEDYGKANASFRSLKAEAKGQVAFWRIRRALSSLEKTGTRSEEKAESLLAMSRAFTTLKDFPMAEHLYRWILREMPGRLPKKEQMAAYLELGQIYEKRGDRRSAYDAYRDALDIDPEFADARERIGHLFPSRANQS